MKNRVCFLTLVVLFMCLIPGGSAAWAQNPLSLTPATSPSAGQPGVTTINVTGSNFPAGTINPAQVVVTLQPASGGGPTASTAASGVTTIVGSTRRVTFTIPSSIAVVSPTPYLVSISGTSSAGVAFASSNSASLTVNPPASISALSPNTGPAGQSVAVTITGSFTNFVGGSTQASFGAGISVDGGPAGGLGPVTVTSSTSATAQLTIDSGAAAGPRTVNVQTGIQLASLVGGFSVQASSQPVLVSVTPNSGQQGQQNLTVTLTGQFTHFVQGTTSASFGAGIIVASLTVNSVTTATAIVSIDPAAAIGGRSASLTTGPEVVTLNNAFTVTAGTPLPVLAPPPLDQTVITSLSAAIEFLYTGPNAVQTGMAPGTIISGRAAVIRGKVLSRDGAALPGVKITILHHPEFGLTLSRADGIFDMAVNGGGQLIVSFEKTGLIAAQRQLNVRSREFSLAPDVVLIPFDTKSTVIDASSVPGATLTPFQVARGTPMTDSDGTRQATLMFPAGIGATMVMPGGGTSPLTRLTVRATEYTVGPNGPQTMPADLPPSSAYTFAQEFSVDEAKAAGAIDVRFNPPLPFYVEDFLNFPVGTTAPLGSYDRAQGVWIPSQSGLVLKILNISSGLANLDTNGDGVADGQTALAALSITDDERHQLALLYLPGQTLWRVLIPHFDQPWDVNWGFGPPDGAVPPDQDPQPDLPCEACRQGGNSIIEVQNQILGEAIAVVGTRFDLHYGSERVPGRKVSNSLDIPLTRSTLPPGLVSVELEIQIAGQLFRQSFSAGPNQRTTFTWDGNDVYGRALQGTQPVTVRIGYTYPGDYRSPQLFGLGGAAVITGSRARQLVTLWRIWQDQVDVGAWDARAAGLGGWTLSDHHVYDPGQQMLYRGDGTRQSARTLGPTISTFAGTGIGCIGGDGGPATKADVCPQGLALGPDGTLYIALPSVNRVRKVAPDGIITTVAGTGIQCVSASSSCGDGGPATLASFGAPFSVAVGPDNSLYIAESQVNRALIRRVDPSGIISTFAGTGTPGFSGDGGPARLAQISSVTALAVGPDGSIYIADQGNRRIRRVGPDGIMTTVAGSDASGFSGDGGPATLAGLSARGVAVGLDGSIYIADTSNHRIRLVTPDGIIRTIAGTGTSGFSGDGGPATAATFASPYAIAVGNDDTIYVNDRENHRIRWLRRDGTINTLAGTGFAGTTGDEGLARQARLQDLETGLAIGPDGSVYVSQTANNLRVRRITPIVERFVPGGIAVPSSDGSEVYLFTANGRHLRTLDALTGVALFQFGYDGAGHLSTVTDRNDNVTTIERDATGNPTSIVSPFGQRTVLVINADGFLSRVTNPAGEAMQIAYSADGLLSAFTKPGGQFSRYTYDALGRLTSATDPTGAITRFNRGGANKSYTVARISPLGRTTTYSVERLDTQDIRMTSIDPAGVQTQVVLGLDGRQTETDADGTVVNLVQGPDPRWGMQAPVNASATITTPGGKTQTITAQRTVTLGSSGILDLRSFTETIAVNGRVTTTAYDAATHTLTTTSPGGRLTSVIVDDRGRQVRTQFGNLEGNSFTYDSRGRLTSHTQGEGLGSRTTSLSYESNGFLSSITDALKQVGKLTTDAIGRVTEETLPDGRLIDFGFDANSNVITRTPPGRPNHTFDYTERDEVSVYTPPVVGSENNQIRFSYNADRQPLQSDHPDGRSIQFQYDDSGRVGVADLSSGQRTFGYDTAGRLISVTAAGTGTPSIALAYSHDGSLPTTTTWSGAVAGSVTRTYDNDFRVTSISVNGSNPVPIQYDADNLPTQVGSLALTRAAQTGLVTDTALGASTDSTSYDSFGAALSYTASQAGTPVYSEQYTPDSLGRLVAKTETMGGTPRTFSYTYDLSGRLTEVRQDGVLNARYAYDANSNRLSVTTPGGTVNATYDAQDRLVQYGTTTYTLTPNGERQSKTDGGQTTTYRYDALGHVIGVTLPDGKQIEYLLDGRSRRIGKRVNGTLVQAFLYQQGLQPIVELDGAGNVISRFVYARQGSPDYIIKAGITYRIVADHLGSPRLVIDVASGVVAQKLDYDAFGRVLLDTNPGFQPFGFAGGLYDQHSALVHFGAREYDSDNGRWTTKDPVGFYGGDVNLFAYAVNDPVNNADTTGLNSVNTTLPGICARDAVACLEIAKVAGTTVAAEEPVRRSLPYLPRAANALTSGANAVSRYLQRLSDFVCNRGSGPTLPPGGQTLPGVGQVGPTPGVVNTIPDLSGTLAAAEELPAFNYAQIRAAELAERTEAILNSTWFNRAVQETRWLRENLPLEDQPRYLRWLLELESLFE